MDTTAAKSERLLKIYSELANGGVLKKRELAQHFHVTERSIQRDIEALRCFFAEEGLFQDVIYDKTVRGYRLTHPALCTLENSEILAVCKILLESRSMRRDEMFPIMDKLIACCVPERNRKAVQELIANEKHHYMQCTYIAIAYVIVAVVFGDDDPVAIAESLPCRFPLQRRRAVRIPRTSAPAGCRGTGGAEF